jgi:uncharacterized membrane protein YkoI
MQTKLKIILRVAVLCFAMAGLAGAAQAFSGEELSKDAAINLAAARAIALKARPGQITDEELEKENGGSGLRYSFDIKGGDAAYEVGVDAKTGAILENSREGKNPD